ncbi:hypothetical protein [Xanthomonas tesorieronis]|uniref:hypothetical protein n=1 Tax=Xanthomonas tesorieronis TaxID=3160839 RepID=UPI003515232C
MFAVVVFANVLASVAVLRAPVFSPSQRFWQLALIWLVPLVGAVVCGVFAFSQALGPDSPGTIEALHSPSDGGGTDDLSVGLPAFGEDGSD